MRWRSAWGHPAALPVARLACALPAVVLVAAVFANQLGANPAEALQHATGLWALRFLCLTLVITPLRIHTRTPQLARFRRLLGLATFYYASLHVLTYLALDVQWDGAAMLVDIGRRPFILVGWLAWLPLALMALTSVRRVARWLGGRRWKRLHRTVYAVAALAVLHFFWMRAGKNDFASVGLYGAILAFLLLDRLLRYALARWRRRRVISVTPPPGASTASNS